MSISIHPLWIHSSFPGQLPNQPPTPGSIKILRRRTRRLYRHTCEDDACWPAQVGIFVTPASSRRVMPRASRWLGLIPRSLSSLNFSSNCLPSATSNDCLKERLDPAHTFLRLRLVVGSLGLALPLVSPARARAKQATVGSDPNKSHKCLDLITLNVLVLYCFSSFRRRPPRPVVVTRDFREGPDVAPATSRRCDEMGQTRHPNTPDARVTHL